jgi:hypothetical protein
MLARKGIGVSVGDLRRGNGFWIAVWSEQQYTEPLHDSS